MQANFCRKKEAHFQVTDDTWAVNISAVLLYYSHIWLLVHYQKPSDSSLRNSWAAYGPGNSNHLEIILTELKDP